MITDHIRLYAKIELARRYFWDYCKLVAPDFYKDSRDYLRDLCETLQRFYESDKKILVVNCPPRHGKSRTATLFVQWLFGQNPKAKVMTGSYNETLSTTFAKQVRDKIWEEKTDGVLVYSDIFPNTRIKYGESSAAKWALDGSEQTNYLATSPTGTATGFGCFPAGTIVYTERGPMDIKDIYNDKSVIRVLTFDEKDGNLRYNLLNAKRKLKSNEIITIKTKNRTITSTIDHRYYVNGRGFVRADEIRIGETLKIAESAVKMRGLRKRVHKAEIRGCQGNKAGLCSRLLFKRMWLSGKCTKSTNGTMSDLWETNKCSSSVLFKRVQKQASVNNVAKDSLPNMQKGISTAFSQGGLLWNGVQEQSTFNQNDRRGKFTLQNWHELFKGVFGRQTESVTAGQLQVSDLWVCREKSAEQEVWVYDELARSSYRPESAEQRAGKSDNSLSGVPYTLAQDEEVIAIEYSNDELELYDLRVEKDHNFFANGALVHNCNIMLIDDLIKSAEEAYNENTLLKHVEWFNNTMLSRTETGFKLIIIMTRWATGDLAGYILDNFDDVEHINYKAVLDDGSMLCDEILTQEDYEFKTKNMNIDIVKANYQQEPIDIKGRLYSSFKTYDGHLPEFREIRNYTDTADTGEDFLCSINYGVTFANEAYVLDVLYTKEPMEITEPATAKMIYDGNVNIADIESNNGGRGFSRAVERITQSKYGSNRTSFRPFTQHKNKVARILSNSTWVMEHVYFPVNWRERWPEYHEAMIKYQKEGKNAHDDAPDATTGIAEKIGQGATFSFD